MNKKRNFKDDVIHTLNLIWCSFGIFMLFIILFLYGLSREILETFLFFWMGGIYFIVFFKTFIKLDFKESYEL